MIDDITYSKLSAYDSALHTAKFADYSHISNFDFKKMLEIFYGKEWPKKTSPSVFSCGHCKLKELKKIAEEYYDYERRTE